MNGNEVDITDDVENGNYFKFPYLIGNHRITYTLVEANSNKFKNDDCYSRTIDNEGKNYFLCDQSMYYSILANDDEIVILYDDGMKVLNLPYDKFNSFIIDKDKWVLHKKCNFYCSDF